MQGYFQDNTMRDALHTGSVEHEEIELSDDELQALKNRARRAVASFDSALPEEYTRNFLRIDDRYTYADFLAGRSPEPIGE
jgi:hypothetical protein